MTSSHHILNLKSMRLILHPHVKCPQGRESILKWKRRWNLDKKPTLNLMKTVRERKPFWYAFRFHAINYWQLIIDVARLKCRDARLRLRKSGRPGFWPRKRDSKDSETSKEKVEEGRKTYLQVHTRRNHWFNAIIRTVSLTLSPFKLSLLFLPLLCHFFFCNLVFVEMML